ncbi:hypothetical protein ACSTD6_18525 [Vibrio vulnificus]|uniref:hypothetical protein n=1 Tax=Vibrio vulnificus TaxID=672 RepID=UPI003EDA5AA4
MTKTRKEKAELSSAAKNKKLSTPPPRRQLSFPRMRGSIHPNVPEATFGNALTATDNDESEANHNTDNEVPKTSHGARYTVGPRVREDDGVIELFRTTSCHSRAYGNPFIHKRQIPRIGNALTATDNDESETNSNTGNEALKTSQALAIRWVPAFARMTE